MILGGSPRGLVIDLTGDAEPAQLPARIACNAIPEHALGSTVALAKGVDKIQLIVVVSEPSDESLAVQTAKEVLFAKFLDDETRCPFDECDGNKIASARRVLADIDKAQLTGPCLDGREQMLVDST